MEQVDRKEILENVFLKHGIEISDQNIIINDQQE